MCQKDPSFQAHCGQELEPFASPAFAYMRQAIASRTAERVALRRAAHQIFDEPKVFEDPLALRIVGPEASAALQAGADEAQEPDARSRRAFLLRRSRRRSSHPQRSWEPAERARVNLA